ncbi:PPK2 family polyphosphate:nucleotide phosphotransferase [Mesonia hippocampi]|uniref:PPK2 family polyphosphate:nucleotide phosphotransferase n=1 Tax=Mesonia hippocampi TaxID=1628250 RepID=A0A840EK05_9FLAO|nr:PPK2 family polyphosphate kinase [Mesonia hippocampi]MBB4119732.1 PPK2 family polyphosphate:nucleotide phosphotransferase [Mesonia hippocampi]
MKKIKSSFYKAKKGVEISTISTNAHLEASEKQLEEKLEKERKKLAKFQNKLYAHAKYSVLICFQGMDTAGKDSLIREVFKDLNARGVVVHSFKTPTSKELKHDYLWRHYIALPERGKFGVFNRTHYENVLVTKVHPTYILNEHLPTVNTLTDIDDDFWEKRYQQLNNFEKNLVENGTIIFKFFLHISKEEQRHRLLRRLNKEEKNWKFSASDIEERKLWDDYQLAYQEAINKTNTAYAPWYIIPSDNKKEARLIVADILYDELKDYDVKEPTLDPKTKANLVNYIKQLENE